MFQSVTEVIASTVVQDRVLSKDELSNIQA